MTPLTPSAALLVACLPALATVGTGAEPPVAPQSARTWTTPFTEQLANIEVSVDRLSRAPAAAMTREPDAGAAELWYGSVLHRVGDDLERDVRLTLFAVRYDAGRAARVWYDANRNGDLADDPEPRLYAHPSSADARSFLVDLDWRSRHDGTELPVARRLRLVVGPLDSTGAPPECRTQNVFGRTGRVTLNGRSLSAMLFDGNVDGLYTDDFADGVFVDLDGDRRLTIEMTSPEFGPFSVPFEMEGRSVRCRPLDPRGDALEWTDLGPAPHRTEVQAGALAPDFTFPDPAGGTRRLSDWRGRWVVVDFWASWCSACVDQAPGLRELYQRWHDRGLEIVGVSFDDAAGEAIAFRERAGHTWPSRITGRRFWEEPVGRLYQAGGAGLLVLVDPSGRVHGRYTDAGHLQQVLAAVMEAGGD